MAGLIVGLALFWAARTNTEVASTVRFAEATCGREVDISIDGASVERVFAGKLSFQDQDTSWTSVCADVRSPINVGQSFPVVIRRSEQMTNPWIRMAGNIVAKYFRAAVTPDQCAGLQLAVWKAMEDCAAQANFLEGHLRARASLAVIAYASKYYQGAEEPGSTFYLQLAPRELFCHLWYPTK